jgi:hypothetical protein
MIIWCRISAFHPYKFKMATCSCNLCIEHIKLEHTGEGSLSICPHIQSAKPFSQVGCNMLGISTVKLSNSFFCPWFESLTKYYWDRLKEMRWAECIAWWYCIGFNRKPQGNRWLRRTRCKWEDSIEMDHKEISWEDVDSILLNIVNAPRGP